MPIHNVGRVAIITKYVGPTNTKPSRIKADAGMKRIAYVDYDHSVSTFEAHAQAAVALSNRFGWPTDNLVAGGTEDGWVFVEGLEAPR